MTPEPVKCGRCGQVNPPGSNFCSRCLGWIGPPVRLDRASTRDLVEELKKREGVEYRALGPYEVKSFGVEGPAIVLTVID